jgi:hypothetical protein
MVRSLFFLLAVGLPAPAEWLIMAWHLGGPHLPEMRLRGYSPDLLHDFLDRLGPTGRSWYAWFQVADLFLIAGLAGTMVAVDRWGLGRLHATGLVLFIVWLPVAYAVVDAAEDIVLLRLIALFDHPVDALSRAASGMTTIKFVLLGAAVLTSVGVALKAFKA